MGRRFRRGRRDRAQRNPLAGSSGDGLGIDEAVPAHPYPIGRLRHVRKNVAPAIVGHDNLAELDGEVGGLGDHPHAGFGTVRPGHDAADVVSVDRDDVLHRLLSGMHQSGRRREHRRHGDERHGPDSLPQHNALLRYRFTYFFIILSNPTVAPTSAA